MNERELNLMTDHEEQIVVTPILAGYLTVHEIAKISQVAVSTLRSYRATKGAGFPSEAFKSGQNPMWAIDDILTWLANRPFAKTVAEKRADGSVIVTKPSGYQDRKASGKIVQD